MGDGVGVIPQDRPFIRVLSIAVPVFFHKMTEGEHPEAESGGVFLPSERGVYAGSAGLEVAHQPEGPVAISGSSSQPSPFWRKTVETSDTGKTGTTSATSSMRPRARRSTASVRSAPLSARKSVPPALTYSRIETGRPK